MEIVIHFQGKLSIKGDDFDEIKDNYDDMREYLDSTHELLITDVEGAIDENGNDVTDEVIW